jgi:coenzyme F420-0:L-glutamate ligase / coenzyme F420-1:gamma-L-glutamate ligase
LAENELIGFIRSRRSVRRFKPQAVPGAVIESILETALWAPSAHNRQPWRFVVLQNREDKARLADSMGAEFRRDLQRDGLSPQEIDAQVVRSRLRILEAPLVILLCLDPSKLDPYPDAARTQAEHVMAIQSVAMAGGALMLAAHAHGLGSVWICAPLFAPVTVIKALDLPDKWEPQGMVLAGFPASIPDPRPRRPLAEVVHFISE